MCRSYRCLPVSIRHLFLEGSPKWLLGRNVTRLCNMLHLNDNILQFPMSNGVQDYVSMHNDETHSSVLLDLFMDVPNNPCSSSENTASLVWNSRSFNEIFCVDNFHLEDIWMFSVMDSYFRYSAALLVQFTSFYDDNVALESTGYQNYGYCLFS